ncbi:MAG: cysteine--tRNA ligase [Rhodospirillaceae bacterium]|jgi:cysteinyl-tRNA synthetase|nr:cysteine--tRNA ligase [Rhodospirillaceae bacterium]MBT7267079.1 cysteine--tRNA ligase [Rhodospirillaceae bacterium]
MSLNLYNTLARAKQEFTPLDDTAIGMYVCGPTVYDYAHIGNARPVIVFDVLFRLLKHVYGADHVTYVRNITDVDDKIITAHQESGEDIGSITSRTTDAFHADMAALGNLEPSIEPRATDHIPQMIEIIEKLIADGHAYEEQGHVCFNVPSMSEYGRLARLNRDELIAGARVDIAPYKKDAADFVLWKPSDEDQPGWDSPWGRGRPGWHIECSAMSSEYLGETFDIHGGGQDLIFPHHENEIAQSCCAHGEGTFAQTWMHNGYLMVEGEKMSKSLGNFITVHELIKDHHGEAVRLCMLMTHYRQPLNWTADGLAQAKSSLDSFYGALRMTAEIVPASVVPSDDFVAALSDDLNSPQAIAVLHELVGALNKAETDEAKAAAKDNLLAAGNLLGLLQLDPEDWFKWTPEGAAEGFSDAEIDDLIEQRKTARANKDFALSDKIRDDLAAQGIVLEDGAGDTSWKRG